MGLEQREDPGRILLMAAHWLGDTFWAMQTVPFLQQRHPRSEIQLLVRQANRWLVRLWLPRARVFASRGLVSDRRREGVLRSLHLVGDLRRVRGGQPPVDLLIDYTNTRASALLVRWLRPAFSLGAGPRPRSRAYSSWRDSRAFEGHLAERPWWILAPIYAASPGWPLQEAQRRPQLPREARAPRSDPGGSGFRDGSAPRDGTRLPDADVLAFPGGGWPEKRWPLERWIELARHLGGEGLAVALLFSPEESALYRQARERLEAARHRGGGAARLSCVMTRGDQLLALLAIARAVVSNDSGAAHLAAARGVPTVVIFGPTNPQICGPLGPRVRVVRAACAQRPEGRQHHCHDEPGYRCDREGLRTVTVSEVHAALWDLSVRGDAAGLPPSEPPPKTESRCGS